MADLAQAFGEMARVVKPGGSIVSLELTRPRLAPIRAFFHAYLFYLVPLVGGMVSGSRSAYDYLPRSIFRFSTPQQVRAIMEQAGLQQVKTYSLSQGLATVHVGRKGKPGQCDGIPQA